PAIITIEGWYNNKEMQDLPSIEYARRGYVVVSMDMHSHGDSESLTAEELYSGAVGIDGVVNLVAALPYVENTQIGLTGHSSGGAATTMEVALDNQRPVPFIKSVFLQAATWQDDLGEDHSADFGTRSVGIIADKYDEFFFYFYNEDGTVRSAPKDFIHTEEAKNFLNFNDGSASFSGEPVAGQLYQRTIDGQDAYRVIHTPTMIHPWVPFSAKCVQYGVDFFETTLGAPNPLPSSSLVAPAKIAFNLLGLIAFVLFFMSLLFVLLDTRVFESLKAAVAVGPKPVPDKTRKLWFWGSLAAGAIFSGFSYRFVYRFVYGNSNNIFPQSGVLTIGVWAAMCGIFTILMMVLYHQLYGKAHGCTLKDIGVSLPLRTLLKTLALAVLVVFSAYTLVFFLSYLFQADFRFWVIAVRPFGADKFWIALRYLPFFLIYYIANSVSINSFNYNDIGGKHGNILLLGLANILAPIIILLIQYGTFFGTGLPFWFVTEGDRMCGIWLFPVVLFLFGAALLSRSVYKRTNNPYLSGAVNAALVTFISCANTTTLLGVAAVVAANY
ncbi:MAG: hypothetical protein RR216_04570, partial [Pseudoflavonifractor sp.]